jgi:hypothetical protein
MAWWQWLCNKKDACSAQDHLAYSTGHIIWQTVESYYLHLGCRGEHWFHSSSGQHCGAHHPIHWVAVVKNIKTKANCNARDSEEPSGNNNSVNW